MSPVEHAQGKRSHSPNTSHNAHETDQELVKACCSLAYGQSHAFQIVLEKDARYSFAVIK
jgi:hypothetical protein